MKLKTPKLDITIKKELEIEKRKINHMADQLTFFNAAFEDR